MEPFPVWTLTLSEKPANQSTKKNAPHERIFKSLTWRGVFPEWPRQRSGPMNAPRTPGGGVSLPVDVAGFLPTHHAVLTGPHHPLGRVPSCSEDASALEEANSHDGQPSTLAT